MKIRPYRENEWKLVVSSDTALSLQSWIEDYDRAGYQTDLRNESGSVRLYVREIA